MSAFRQSGHQRRGIAARSIAGVGASAKTITAMIATGTTPDDEAPLPAPSGNWQNQRKHQHDGQDLADQQAIRVNGGGESDAIRDPGAHGGRHRHLHDGHAGSHRDRHGIEPHGIGQRAAQSAADRGQREPDHQCSLTPSRAISSAPWHSREGEQHRRQSSEETDLGCA